MTKILININKLSCERDDRLLIEGLDLSLAKGQVLQIEGPNGSGKTTLLRILCGLSEDYEGEIFWSGQSRYPGPLFRQQTLYFGHNTGVKSALTPRENLAWIIGLKGTHSPSVQSDSELDKALAAVGLAGFEDVAVATLSAGQKRRVALARLYLDSALLWVLDEPFTAIDKQGVVVLEQLIMAHAARGGTVLITTHHALQVPSIRKLQLGLGRGEWQIS